MNVNNIPTFYEKGITKNFIIDKQSTVNHDLSESQI